MLDNITSDKINLSDTQILNIPKVFDLNEYSFSSPKMTTEESKFIDRELLINELFKLKDIFKSIHIAKTEVDKFIQSQNEFIKYFQNSYLSEKSIYYHLSHYQRNYESKREEFIIKQKKNLIQQIDLIYNLNTINGYVLDEFINSIKLKEYFSSEFNTRKLIDLVIKKYNHFILTKNLSIQSYKGFFNFFYERGIFDPRPFKLMKSEIQERDKLINYLHGLYILLKIWFGSDMILQHDINLEVKKTEHKEFRNIKDGIYLMPDEDPNDYPQDVFETEIITWYKEEYKSIIEYKYARGISGRWYSKMMKEYNEKEELEFSENESYEIFTDGKKEEKKIIYKVRLPQKLISLFNELYTDISNILSIREFDEFLDLMNLTWIKTEWLDIRDVHIIDLKTHFIYSNIENIDFLMNVNKYKYSGCFEPFYLTCLEQIGEWGWQDFKKPELYSKTYLTFKKYENLIDDLPHYPEMLPSFKLADFPERKYPFKTTKHLAQVSEECKVPVDELYEFLPEIVPLFSKKYIPEDESKLNVKKEYRILLKKFKILPLDLKSDHISKKSTTQKESHLIGYEDIKQFIEDSLELYKDPDQAKTFGLSIETSMILYGPPGCGKTAWANEIARLLDLKLEKITRDEFGSTYVDGAMLGLTKRLNEIEKKAPVAVFFDEFDSVAPRREAQRESNDEGKKVVNTLLQRIQDMLGKGIVVLAATNFIGDLDSAVIRPGRFNLHIPIFPPLPNERIEIILHYLTEDNAEAIIQVLSNTDADTNDFWIEYVDSMLLFSNSHVISFCNHLKNYVFKQAKTNGLDEIIFTEDVLINALNIVKSQIRKADIEIYKKFYSDSENLIGLFKERMNRLKYEIDMIENHPDKSRRKVGY